MRSETWFVHVASCCFAAASIFCSQVSLAQTRDPLLNVLIRQEAGIPTITDHARSALDSLNSLAREHAEMTKRLDEARKSYWDAYKAGAASQEQLDLYSLLLFQKDLYFMTSVVLPEGLWNPKPNPAAALFKLAGTVDSGIPPEAQHAFGAWAEAIRTELGAKRGSILTVGQAARIGAAIEKTLPAFVEYAWRRDLVEFRNASVRPPGFDEPAWAFIPNYANHIALNTEAPDWGLANTPFRFVYANQDPFDCAAEELAWLRKRFGVDRVNQSFSKINALPKDGMFLAAPLPVPPSLGNWSDVDVADACIHSLANDSARDWFALMRRYYRAKLEDSFPASDRKFDELVAFTNEALVTEVTQRVRAAPINLKPNREKRVIPNLLKPGDLGLATRLEVSYGGPGSIAISWTPSEAVAALVQGRTAERGRRKAGEGPWWTAQELEIYLRHDVPWAKVELVKAQMSYDGVKLAYAGTPAAVAELEKMAMSDATPPEDAGKAAYLCGELVAHGVLPGGAARALEWFERGAKFDNQDAIASCALAGMQGNGMAVNDARRDPAATFALATRAAELRSGQVYSSRQGYYALALHYERGIGVLANDKTAGRWYRLAAMHGHAAAKEWVAKREQKETTPPAARPERSRGRR